jgi:molybdate transport system regulatory protein
MPRQRPAASGTRLSIRVDLGTGLRIGPGKVALLEAIGATGSISAAARTLGMSYKRAWDLVEELNNGCRHPVVSASPGGRDGGGTRLTETGDRLIHLYREIERTAHEASRAQIRALNRVTPAP